MRYLYTCIALLAIITSAAAQQLTATELISKIKCKDTSCYQALFKEKGYVSMPSYMKSAKVVNYTQKTVDCIDSKGSKSYAMLTVETWPKGPAFKITTLCVDNYNTLLNGFIAAGFTVDMKNTSSAPGLVESITTAKYTSAEHPGMILYAGKGDKNGKTFCIVRLMAE